MAVSALAKKAIDDALRLAIPDASQTVSAWAESYRVVDRGARKGRWSNKTVPFLTEIMDCVTAPDIREIAFMKSSQVGGSELAVNIIGYYIHIDPTEIIYCAEKEDKAKAWVTESFDPTVRTTEVLSRLVRKSDEDNNQRVKRFPGGQLNIVWATSPAELSSRPAQVLIFDEPDGYAPTKEGDAIKLGEARTKTFDGTEKIIKISTPRFTDTSEIERSFLRGDKRMYWVPCPSCEDLQTLEWKNVHWDDGDPDTAFMVCAACGVQIEYEDLQWMLENGRWIKDADLEVPRFPDAPTSPEVASFKINQLYSPFVRWSRMAKDHLAAKRQKNALQVWVNTALGESWKPEERIEFADLVLNREDYEAQVPHGVLVLTAGVDVQKDRLEYEIVGWGRDDESWSIEVGICEGDAGQMAVWDELTDRLTQVFTGVEGQEFRVQCAFIDSGYHTQMVYRFCKANAGRRWFACKGLGDPQKPILSKATWSGDNPKIRMFPIGTNAAKDDIFSKLQITEHGPGFCHFPARDEYDDAYLKQLCSEKKIKFARHGVEYYRYEKVSAGVRNEALDIRVYATAARVKLNPNYEKLATRRLQHIEVADREAEPMDGDIGPKKDPPNPPLTPQARRRTFRVIDSSRRRR